MREIEKVTVGLTAEMAKEVAKSVQDGEFTTAGEAIRDALRLWIQERKVKEQRIKFAAEQLESGPRNWLPLKFLSRDQ